MLAQELEEQERLAVVQRRVLVEVAPVVQLGVRLTEELLVEAVGRAGEALAELGVALVEPHDRSHALVELDHVAELMREDRVEAVRREASGRRVHVDHLALGRELVDPDRVLVRRRVVPGRAARDARDEDIDARVGVDPGRPLGAVRGPVRRVDLGLELRRRRLQRRGVDRDAVGDPPLRMVREDPEGGAHLHVLLGVEIVRPELRLAADGLVRRGLPRGRERGPRGPVATPHAPGQLEQVRGRQRVLGQGVGHVEDRRVQGR